MVYSLQLRLPSLGKAGQTSERQVGGATDPGSPKESDWPPANSVKTHIRTSHSDSSPNESEWILWPLKSESDTKSDSVGLLAPKGESESYLAPSAAWPTRLKRLISTDVHLTDSSGGGCGVGASRLT